MASILPFDALNSFTVKLRGMFPDGKLPKTQEAKEEEKDIIDEMLDLFLLAYATGNTVTNENLAFDWNPTADDAIKVVDKEVAGKTWRDRVEDWFSSGGSVDDLVRIAETEVHRDANEAALETAKRAGAKTKTWITMMDDRVREDHDYLLGQTVGINEDFYTWQGYSAPAPGMFGIPEEDINCRCELLFS